MTKKDIFRIDNYLIGFGIFFLIVGVISIAADPRSYSDFTAMGTGTLEFGDFDGRTLEQARAEYPADTKILVNTFPLKRLIIGANGVLMLIIGIFYRSKEKKIIAIWDSLEKTGRSKVRDLEFSLGLSRDFIMKHLKDINAQPGVYYAYVSETDSIVDGRLMAEHVLVAKCTGCGNTINERFSLAAAKAPACGYCGTAIPTDELSKLKEEIFKKEEVKAEGGTFSIPIFILLLIFFWPAAIGYLIVKKGKALQSIPNKINELQQQAAQHNQATPNTGR